MNNETNNRMYDLFIGYHGTNDGLGSYETAKKLGDELKCRGFDVYVHRHLCHDDGKDSKWINTDCVIYNSKCMIIVINDCLEINDRGEIITNYSSSVLQNECVVFKGLKGYGERSQDDFRCLYCSNKEIPSNLKGIAPDLFLGSNYDIIKNKRHGLDQVAVDEVVNWLYERKIKPFRGSKVTSVKDINFKTKKLNIKPDNLYLTNIDNSRCFENFLLSDGRYMIISGVQGTGKWALVKNCLASRDEQRIVRYIEIIDDNIDNDADNHTIMSALMQEINMQIGREQFDKDFSLDSFILDYIETNEEIIVFKFAGICKESVISFIKFVNAIQTKSKLIFILSYANEQLFFNRSEDIGIVYIKVDEFNESEAKDFLNRILDGEFNTQDRTNSNIKQRIIQKLVSDWQLKNPANLKFCARQIIADWKSGMVDTSDVYFNSIRNNEENQLLKLIWDTRLNDEQKKILLFIYFSKTSINIMPLFQEGEKFIRNLRAIKSRELCCNISWSTTGRQSNPASSSGEYPMYSIQSVVREFLSKIEESEDDSKFVSSTKDLWISSLVQYCKTAYESMERKNDRTSGYLNLLDQIGGINVLYHLISTCFKEKRYHEVVSLGNSLSYYFYVHGCWTDVNMSIEGMREESARRIDDNCSYLLAIASQLNLYAKLGNVECVASELGKLDSYRQSYNDCDYGARVFIDTSIIAAEIALGNFDNALILLDKVSKGLNEDDDHNKSVIVRRQLDCYMGLGKMSFEDIIVEISKIKDTVKDLDSKRSLLYCELIERMLRAKYNQNTYEEDDRFISLSTQFQGCGDEPLYRKFCKYTIQIYKERQDDEKAQVFQDILDTIRAN